MISRFLCRVLHWNLQRIRQVAFQWPHTHTNSIGFQCIRQKETMLVGSVSQQKRPRAWTRQGNIRTKHKEENELENEHDGELEYELNMGINTTTKPTTDKCEIACFFWAFLTYFSSNFLSFPLFSDMLLVFHCFSYMFLDFHWVSLCFFSFSWFFLVVLARQRPRTRQKWTRSRTCTEKTPSGTVSSPD